MAAIPAEPRQYVARLHQEYNEVQANQRASHERHLSDAVAFAESAWRRPLTSAEEQSLRRFYHELREKYELDHARGIRALISRVLVSPEFLYRFEEPKPGAGLIWLLPSVSFAKRTRTHGTFADSLRGVHRRPVR